MKKLLSVILVSGVLLPSGCSKRVKVARGFTEKANTAVESPRPAPRQPESREEHPPVAHTDDSKPRSAARAEDNKSRVANERIVLLSFDGTHPSTNGSEKNYPNNYPSHGGKEGGKATVAIEKVDAISGHSLRMHLTEGNLYAQFNPYNEFGKPSFPSGRGFARQYGDKPKDWKLNTYNRMRFWIKVPVNGPEMGTKGHFNVEFGTYVKRVKDLDRYSDEAGGNHYYHFLNLPAIGEWTQVVLNMRPDHARGDHKDPGVQSHPTKEMEYNYFDVLTRFYISYPYVLPKSHPADFLLDNIEFYREPARENDLQVYALTGTYRHSKNHLILTWNRKMDEEKVKHEVRYAFSDIHASGWKTAKQAPKGLASPPGDGAYNGMVYDTTALPLAGHSVVYVAIKPENSDVFTQIVVPLTIGVKTR
ncbi:MAG TPA: hypothetical protein VN688_05025 [Gemmataceae bacterium]|nr:hypothetical protein [Gemmataceae bacterium]